jgi:threonine synthase
MSTPTVKIKDNFYLKMENLCNTMSHKERLASIHINNALVLGYKNITVGSCGNYGFSIIKLARKNKLNVKIFIPQTFKDNRFSKKDLDYIEFIGLSYEESVKNSINYAKDNNYYDANCFSVNSEFSYKAYYGLAEEIETYFINNIQNICLWIPIGNGITFTSIFRYFNQKNIRIRYGIVGSLNNSSPIASMINKIPTPINLDNIKMSKYNRPLINYELVDNTQELIQISKNNWIVEVSDKEIYKAWTHIKTNQPSGCAALAGFYQKEQIVQKYTNVILITA